MRTTLARRMLAVTFAAGLVTGCFAQQTQPIISKTGWVMDETFGPIATLGNAIGSALGTWRDSPPEWGSHWSGFADRAASNYGTGLISNSMEIGLGSRWNEDPRYRRLGSGPRQTRFWHAMRMAVLVESPDSSEHAAWARYISIPSANFISDAWLPPRDRQPGHTGLRIGVAFAERAGANAFAEFWPDIRNRIFHRSSAPTSGN